MTDQHYYNNSNPQLNLPLYTQLNRHPLPLLNSSSANNLLSVNNTNNNNNNIALKSHPHPKLHPKLQLHAPTDPLYTTKSKLKLLKPSSNYTHRPKSAGPFNKNQIANNNSNNPNKSFHNNNNKFFAHNHTNSKYNNVSVPVRENKTTFKFKSGEKFTIYSYFSPRRIIGEGSYASVCSAIDTRNNTCYAIKKNRNAFTNIGDAKRILRELKLMKHFRNHPYLMSIIDVISPEIGTQQSFNDVYLIMPKMHMPLNKLINKTSIKKIIINENDVKSIVYQMMRGLQHMHDAGVIHRDLKPENILINMYQHHCKELNCNIQNKRLWKVRITDFGLARGILDCGDCNNFNGNNNGSNNSSNVAGGELTEYVVTRYYRAPEVMCCSRLYDSQIDVWSLGCIMGEIYYKKPLFKGTNHLHQLQLIFYYTGTPNNDDIDQWVKMDDAKEWIKQLDIYKKKNYKKEFSFYNYNKKHFKKINNNNNKLNNLFDGQVPVPKNTQNKPVSVSVDDDDDKEMVDITNNTNNNNNQAIFIDDKCGIMSDLAMDVIDKLLICNPYKRWNITRALKHPFFADVYNDKDYIQSTKFDTSFENEPILRTNFGVRHMMYEELLSIHKQSKLHHNQNYNNNHK